MGKLVLLFTLLPLLDLWLLLGIGEAIGPWPTVGIVVATGVTGAALARAEGMRVIRAWQRALQEGRVPEEGVLSGALVLAGGLLLVTPGVLTDAVGLALLVPFTRRIAMGALRRWFARQVETGRVRVVTWPPPAPREEPQEIDVTPRGPRDEPPSA